MNNNPLKELVNKQKQGKAVGIYSACSANVFVLEAVIEQGLKENSCVLIESTANQSDQFGGYTGMKPHDFKLFVEDIANKKGFPLEKLFLGGDHLGPLTWTNLNEVEAMKNAKDLIEAYVLAGFSKIHIDTSMKVASDDADIRLSDEIIASRGAILARVANNAYHELLKQQPSAPRPVYIIGSEVPIPGGAQEEETIQVTKTSDLKHTIDAFYHAFQQADLLDIWNDIIGIVVQPGVEFGDAEIEEYNRDAAKELTASLSKYDTLIFEGHSTDYQTKQALKEMVEDGIGILKVGPGLTFALREALFALTHIEQAMYVGEQEKQSHFIEVLEQAMLKEPNQWIKHYHGDEQKLQLARKYSFSDRCRYYLPKEEVQAAIETLRTNLTSKEIPLTLLSQYMPIEYTKVREHKIANKVDELIKSRIVNCLEEYTQATNQKDLF